MIGAGYVMSTREGVPVARSESLALLANYARSAGYSAPHAYDLRGPGGVLVGGVTAVGGWVSGAHLLPDHAALLVESVEVRA